MSTQEQTSNPLPKLDTATEAALRASIQRFGAGLVACIRDQYAVLVDGHNRERIADEEGCSDTLRYDTVDLPDDEEERAAAIVAINDSRRPRMNAAQRREVVVSLREQGHSTTAIAGAVGVSDETVRRDLSVSTYVEPQGIVGQDGKTYPASRAKPAKEENVAATVTTPPALVGKPLMNARKTKERVEGVVGTCNAFAQGLPALRVEEATHVADMDEAKGWVESIKEGERALCAVRKRIQESIGE